jgi:hypothetical protein
MSRNSATWRRLVGSGIAAMLVDDRFAEVGDYIE